MTELLEFENFLKDFLDIKVDDFIGLYCKFCVLDDQNKNLAIEWYQKGNQEITLSKKLIDFEKFLKESNKINLDEFLHCFLYFKKLSNYSQVYAVSKYLKNNS